MSDSDPPRDLDILLGRADDVHAEVFVRAPDAGDTTRITGSFTGPHRGSDTTLPITARLQPAAMAGVARAIITEPAYWTPDLPNLYRLRATIERINKSSTPVDRPLGLRRLGVRGRSLWLDGRRWVPRGVLANAPDLDACKAAQVAAVVADPDERILVRADALGVAVIVMLSAVERGDALAIVRGITTRAAHASAVVAVLPPTLGLDDLAWIATASRDARGTQLLAAVVSGAAPPPSAPPAGIDLLIVHLASASTPHVGWRAGSSLPLIAWHDGVAPAGPSRAPCDALQAALADWGTSGGSRTLAWDWAGYLVGHGSVDRDR